MAKNATAAKATPAKKAAKAPAKAASAPKKRTAGALAKPVTPSPTLAAIVGAAPLPRTEVVSKVWAYIRGHGLQDTSDKRTIVADDKLRAIFGQDKATMFEMNALLSKHLT